MTKETTKETYLNELRQQLENIKTELADMRRVNGDKPVFGEGNTSATIMFIGEAPGANEAKTGRPFCGASGKLLDEMLATVNLKRKDVYITNIVKDRPENNRDPKPSEIAEYAFILDEQIKTIKPKIIVTLGRYSMQYIFEREEMVPELHKLDKNGDKANIMSKVHGRVFSKVTKATSEKITILPLYHPAYGLYNGGMRPTLFKDFQQLKSLIRKK